MEIRKCEIEVMIVMAQYRWRAKKREKARVSLKASQDGGEKEGSPRRAEKALCYYARPRHRMNF